MKTCFRRIFTKRLLVAVSGVMTCAVQGGVGVSFPIAGEAAFEGVGSYAAYDGSNVLVGIESGATNHLYFQFVDPSGGLSGSRIDPGLYGDTPQIGFHGGTYLLTWSGLSGLHWQVFGQRLNTVGALLGSPFQISFSTGDAFPGGLTRIPFGSERFLMVWQDYRDVDKTSDLYGRFVKKDGTLGSQELTVVDAPGDDANYSMDYGGGNFLVVFSAERRAGMDSGQDIYGQLVTPGIGRVGSNFVIDQNDFPSDNPTGVCWDGEKYTVLFHDEVNGQWDVHARFVSSDGVVAPARMAIAASPDASEMFPSIAFDGSRYLITLTAMFSPSNAVAKGRFYDRQLSPLTSWFALAPPSTTDVPVAAAIETGEGRFMAGVSRLEIIEGAAPAIRSSVGVVVTPDAPAFDQGGLAGTNYRFTIVDLFPGTTNHLERIESLTSTNGWMTEQTFFCTSPSTNLNGTVGAAWSRQFFRLRME